MKSLGEKLFDAAMKTSGDAAKWSEIGITDQAQCEKTALAFAASLSHDETATTTTIEGLRDTVEGLNCDLRLAVETAYHRGATEWTRLNYPKWFAELEAYRAAPNPQEAKSDAE